MAGDTEMIPALQDLFRAVSSSQPAYIFIIDVIDGNGGEQGRRTGLDCFHGQLSSNKYRHSKIHIELSKAKSICLYESLLS